MREEYKKIGQSEVSQGGQVQGQKNRTQKNEIKHLSAFDLSAKLSTARNC
jgi:hypothetical protein